MLSTVSASRRSLPAFAALALGVSVALTACSPAGGERPATPAGACTTPGSSSDSIDVTGGYGEVPVVEFESPLAAERTERTVLVEGDGSEAAEAGMQVSASYSLYSGDTGEEIGSTGFGDEGVTEAFLIADEGVEGLVRTLNCAVVGDRIAAVIPTDELGLGAEMGETVVLVMDVVEVGAPANASDDLKEVEPGSAGLPEVTLNENAPPAVTIPDTDAPEDLTLVVFEEGDGETVKEGDAVEVNYTGINWSTGASFDSSWSRGTTATFATNEVISGFGAALVDRTVGTRLMVVIPPEYGYGPAGQPSAAIEGTDTIMFVVDIVGIGG